MPYKPIIWIGDSRKSIREFPDLAKQRCGRELARVQDGLDPADWKPMTSVGIGVREIRVRIDGAFRVIYVAKFPEAVYVLHAFEKKSQKTAKADIELARDRFRALIAERNSS
jgi:phage-related protein